MNKFDVIAGISPEVMISPKQETFIQSGTRGTIFLGGIRSGKTYVACYKGILKALKGKRGAIISFSYRTLDDVIVYTMKDCLRYLQLIEGRDWSFSSSSMTFLIRGTEILLRSGDSPEKLRGLSLNWFALDEAREFPDDTIFLILIGRLSIGEDASWTITTTTKGKNWCYSLVAKEGLLGAFTSGIASNDNLTVIIQRVEENPFLPPGYIDELLRSYTSTYAEQELHASIIDMSGGIFHESWFQDRDQWFKPITGVRYWDLAASIKTSADFSVGVLLSKRDSLTYVVDVVKDKVIYPQLKELIINTAIADGPGVVIGLESVGMQLAIVDDIMADSRLANYKVKADKPKGDKLARSLPLAARFEQGILKLCNGAWNDEFIDEFTSFDGQGDLHDDIVDATSGAWSLINRELVFKPIKTQEIMTVSAEDQALHYLQKIVAIEILDYKCYIVRAVWHRTKEQLQIVDEVCATMIDDIVDWLKPIKKRVGTKQLDSESYKSIYQTLVKKDCNVAISSLDQLGTVLWLNNMILHNQFYISHRMATYADMSASDTDTTLSPYVKCVLYIAQEIRSWKPAPVKEYGPFERQKEEFRTKMRKKAMASKEWVG